MPGCTSSRHLRARLQQTHDCVIPVAAVTLRCMQAHLKGEHEPIAGVQASLRVLQATPTQSDKATSLRSSAARLGGKQLQRRTASTKRRNDSVSNGHCRQALQAANSRANATHVICAQLGAFSLGLGDAALGGHAAQAVPVRLALGAQHVWRPCGCPDQRRRCGKRRAVVVLILRGNSMSARVLRAQHDQCTTSSPGERA